MNDKNRKMDISAFSKLAFILFFAILANQQGIVEGLRMKPVAITSSSDILMVGVPARLTCNYIKYQSEKIREITWYAGYNGMSRKIYHHDIAGGQSKPSIHGWIKPEEGTANEKELSITLPEFREGKMMIKCEVKAKREIAGRINLITKSGETELDVADAHTHQLMLKKGRPTASLQGVGQDRSATIGDQLIVSCISFGATQTPNLTLHVNDQEFKNIYGGRVNEENVQVSGNSQHSQGVALVGYIDTVSNNLFNGGSNLLVECKAWYGDQMFKKKDLSLRKKDTGRRPNNVNGQHNYGNGGGGGAVQLPRTGRGFQDHAEAVHSHLIELMDPSRHIHPGIPYDFYSGYVVVEAKNLDDQNQNYGQESTVVLGQLPQVVRAKLEEQWGKYQYVNDNKIIMKLNAVKVLNLLGSMDYRVIGTSSPDTKVVAWTLEHKDFAKLKELQENDLNHQAHHNRF